MRRPATAPLLGLLLVALAVGPAAATAPVRLQAERPSATATSLASALAADGTFHGRAGVAGTLDARTWTLTSDLASGEPPRFAPVAAAAAAAAATPTTRGWSPLGSNAAGTGGALTDQVTAVAVSGTDLYVAGYFTNAAAIPQADYVARWNGTAWSALGSNVAGTDGAISDVVLGLAVWGSVVHVGGAFQNAAGIARADNIARWNGTAWSALGSNPGGTDGAIIGLVTSIAAAGADDVYVGGTFEDAAGIATADRVARFTAGAWSSLGSNPGGTDGAITQGSYYVLCLALAGGDVYVGGLFLNVADIAQADYAAYWDGSDWNPLGSNVAFTDGALSHMVNAIAVVGSDVYVAGQFSNARGIPQADSVARWTRTVDPFANAWSALGANPAGTDGAVTGTGRALAVSGTDIYLGGDFTDVAGIPQADSIARWNGGAWVALGGNSAGTNGALTDPVHAIALSPGIVFAGGAFQDAAGIATADYAASFRRRQPDGRIQRGSAPFAGEGIYNTTALDQKRSATVPRGSSVTFGISIDNDGAAADRFRVAATGAGKTGYSIRYFRGATDITSAVLGGTYQTPVLASGATFLITARVSVGSTAATGSSVTRLVTSTSLADTARRDAVRFIVNRG